MNFLVGANSIWFGYRGGYAGKKNSAQLIFKKF